MDGYRKLACWRYFIYCSLLFGSCGMISDILRYIIYHRASQFSRFDVQFYPDYVFQKAEASKNCLQFTSLRQYHLENIYKFPRYCLKPKRPPHSDPDIPSIPPCPACCRYPHEITDIPPNAVKHPISPKITPGLYILPILDSPRIGIDITAMPVAVILVPLHGQSVIV